MNKRNFCLRGIYNLAEEIGVWRCSSIGRSILVWMDIIWCNFVFFSGFVVIICYVFGFVFIVLGLFCFYFLGFKF